MELRLHWGALDIVDKSSQEYIESISRSKRTIETGAKSLTILEVKSNDVDMNPIRLKFASDEIKEWETDLESSSSWKMENHYSNLLKIGQGSFGLVFSAVTNKDTHMPKGHQIIMKRTNRCTVKNRDFQRDRDELEIWEKMTHKNLLRVEDILIDDNYVYIIPEEFESDLNKLIRNKSINDDLKHKNIFMDILHGLAHMHAKGTLHRDLKPDIVICNELGGDRFKVKICDFGHSTRLNDEEEVKDDDPLGTRGYRAPEVLQGPPYTFSTKSDIWALGVMLCQAQCDNEMPFEFAASEQLSQHIPYFDATLNATREEAREVILRMLPSAEELLQMPFFLNPISENIARGQPKL